MTVVLGTTRDAGKCKGHVSDYLSEEVSGEMLEPSRGSALRAAVTARAEAVW